MTEEEKEEILRKNEEFISFLEEDTKKRARRSLLIRNFCYSLPWIAFILAYLLVDILLSFLRAMGYC